MYNKKRIKRFIFFLVSLNICTLLYCHFIIKEQNKLIKEQIEIMQMQTKMIRGIVQAWDVNLSD